MSNRRVGGTSFVKVDSEQLSLTGGIEVPMNTNVKESIIGLDGSVHYKETYRAPYTKGTYKIPADFPIDKITSSDSLTVTTELANGKVYVLSNAWVEGEVNHNAEEGTAEIEFHGEEGFYQ